MRDVQKLLAAHLVLAMIAGIAMIYLALGVILRPVWRWTVMGAVCTPFACKYASLLHDSCPFVSV